MLELATAAFSHLRGAASAAMDIAELADGRLVVIEANPAWCSGFYDMRHAASVAGLVEDPAPESAEKVSLRVATAGATFEVVDEDVRASTIAVGKRYLIPGEGVVTITSGSFSGDDGRGVSNFWHWQWEGGGTGHGYGNLTGDWKELAELP